MARFAPPLTKPGIHRCPRCGERRLARDFWLKPEWRCPQCQSLLGWDAARRNVATAIGVLVIVAGAVAIPFLPAKLWCLFLVLGIQIAVIFFTRWWLDSIVLVEEPAGPQCSGTLGGT